MGIAIAAVVGVGVYFLTGGETPGVIKDVLDGGSERPTPNFEFDLQQAKYEATVAGADKEAQAATAVEVGDDVKAMMDDMFFVAFVDPETWGDTGEISGSFTGEAAETLEANVETLTLGADAGDVYAFVEPGRSTLHVRVLTDGKGNPLRAYAGVHFVAVAEHADGTFSQVTIDGTFFLLADGGEWEVEAYRAARLEREIEPPPSPAASASATSGTESSS